MKTFYITSRLNRISNRYFKCLLTYCVFCSTICLNGHSPDVSSTLLVEESEGKWVLQIRAALTAFEYEVENHFGQTSYATPEEFKDLVLTHVKENVLVKSNNQVALLKNGKVKLGHETSVTFEVNGITKILEAFFVSNSSFKNISRNQSALIVLKKGMDKDQFRLDNSNQHSALLSVNESAFELQKPIHKSKAITYLILLIGFCLFAFVFVIYKYF